MFFFFFLTFVLICECFIRSKFEVAFLVLLVYTCKFNIDACASINCFFYVQVHKWLSRFLFFSLIVGGRMTVSGHECLMCFELGLLNQLPSLY